MRHVNGRRDVVFDPRTTLPEIPGVPAAPNTPTQPYWITTASPAFPWPADATWNGTTLSFDLAGSSYDPQTKTCYDVGCHVAGTPVWGRSYGWGLEQCTRCHEF
jgi:predicted CxxxxCH...CXXCH cytochrome family protein